MKRLTERMQERMSGRFRNCLREEKGVSEAEGGGRHGG